MLTGEQIRAARALLRWEQKDLASAAGVSLETVKRLEKVRGEVSAMASTVEVIQKALGTAGVEFIAENGGGEGVRFRQRRADRTVQSA